MKALSMEKFLHAFVFIHMRCELCGKETRKLYPVLIEGVEMMVCEECKKFGTPIAPKKKASIAKPVKKIVPYSKDVFQNMDRDLLPGWGEKIKKARMARGWSREELGAKVGEKTTTIAKIENEELRPPDKTVEKLEKVLEIKLFEEVKGHVVQNIQKKPLTLGDIIKLKKDE